MTIQTETTKILQPPYWWREPYEPGMYDGYKDDYFTMCGYYNPEEDRLLVPRCHGCSRVISESRKERIVVMMRNGALHEVCSEACLPAGAVEVARESGYATLGYYGMLAQAWEKDMQYPYYAYSLQRVAEDEHYFCEVCGRRLAKVTNESSSPIFSHEPHDPLETSLCYSHQGIKHYVSGYRLRVSDDHCLWVCSESCVPDGAGYVHQSPLAPELARLDEQKPVLER